MKKIINNNQGLVIIISGPSGVGKGTLIKQILKKEPSYKLAVSATTRKPRNNEINGKDYYFLSNDKFENKIQKEEFLEWCIVHGNKYGTPIKEIENLLKQENIVLLEIDVQGASKIRDKIKNQATIFIRPPSFKELANRLSNRKTEKGHVIDKRLEIAENELASIEKYDYIVVNDNIDKAVANILNIITSHRLQKKEIKK